MGNLGLAPKKAMYARQIIHAMFVAAIPLGYFLFARLDHIDSGFFLVIPLALLFFLLALFRSFVLVCRRRISWFELLCPVLLLAVAVAFVHSGFPSTIGRNLQFSSFEERFNKFVSQPPVNLTDSLENIVVPWELSRSGIRAAFGKRYDDGSILVIVLTGGAGGYAYSSENSDAAVEDLNRREPYRWRVAENWEAFSR